RSQHLRTIPGSAPGHPRGSPGPIQARFARMPVKPEWPRGPAIATSLRLDPAPLINLRWLVLLRWGAVAGQAATIAIATRLLHQPLPALRLLSICVALAVVNLGVQIWLWNGGQPTDRACALNLLVDIAELTSVLALSGGPLNPFAALYLIHITIAAVILP